MSNKGFYRISKRAFYYNGGLSNPDQFRQFVDGAWHYYAIIK